MELIIKLFKLLNMSEFGSERLGERKCLKYMINYNFKNSEL